jgi:hypothetical protein
MRKRPGRDLHQYLPSSAEDKNEWSYTFIPPVCLLWIDRDNFTFTLFLIPITEWIISNFKLYTELRATNKSLRPSCNYVYYLNQHFKRETAIISLPTNQLFFVRDLRRRNLIFKYVYIRLVKLKTSSGQNPKSKLSFCAATDNVTSFRHYLLVNVSMWKHARMKSTP